MATFERVSTRTVTIAVGLRITVFTTKHKTLPVRQPSSSFRIYEIASPPPKVLRLQNNKCGPSSALDLFLRLSSTQRSVWRVSTKQLAHNSLSSPTNVKAHCLNRKPTFLLHSWMDTQLHRRSLRTSATSTTSSVVSGLGVEQHVKFHRWRVS